jgi:ABC-2 type transport system permease protein
VKKFKYLLTFGLKKRMGTKSFIIGMIVASILVLIFSLLPSIIGGSIDDSITIYKIDYVNNSSVSDEKIENLFHNSLDSSSFGIDLYKSSKTYANPEVVDYEDFSQYLVIFEDSGDVTNFKSYLHYNETELLALLSNSLNNFRLSLLLEESPEFGEALAGSNTVVNNPKFDNELEEFGVDTIFSLIFALPLFIFVVLGLQFLGTEIVEEKSSKAIETIISSVPPFTHYCAKILSIAIYVLTMFTIILLVGVLGSTLGSLINPSTDSANIDTSLSLSFGLPNLGLGLLFLFFFTVFGALCELAIGALFAASSNTQEDFSQVLTPFMLVNVFFFYIMLFLPIITALSPSINISTIYSITSFIPILSAFTTPYGIAAGYLPLWQGFVSLLIMIAALLLIVKYTSPIYKIAILSYDETKASKRLTHYIKKTFGKNKQVK